MTFGYAGVHQLVLPLLEHAAELASEAQELRVDTELTRKVHTLTAEIHRHIVGVERDDGVAGDENVPPSNVSSAP